MCIPLRVREYDISTKVVTILLRGLGFINGVALSKDKSIVLVDENSTGKIVRWQTYVTPIKLRKNGQVLEVSEDVESKTLEFISEVEEKNDKLWIGSVMVPFVGFYGLAVEKLISGQSTGGRRTHWSLIGGDCGRVLVVCGQSHWWCAFRDIDGVWSELLVVCGVWTQHTGGVWSERRTYGVTSKESTIAQMRQYNWSTEYTRKLGGAQVIAYAWVGRRLTNRLCLGWAAPNQSPMLTVSHENGHNFLLGFWIKAKLLSLES
ncbi:Type-a response regulator [Capsicum annuum]|nr:Type-a response regulator [Capsicum annuum]